MTLRAGQFHNTYTDINEVARKRKLLCSNEPFTPGKISQIPDEKRAVIQKNGQSLGMLSFLRNVYFYMKKQVLLLI